MDAAAIATAAKHILELEKALGWLRAHGLQALDHSDAQSFGVSFSLNSCSALPGAKEAASALSAQARLMSTSLLQAAIRDAENTIQIYRNQIAEAVKD